MGYNILSNKLGNAFKIKDSLCNYGVSLYYCGNFEEALNNLENAFNKLTNKGAVIRYQMDMDVTSPYKSDKNE